MIIELNLKIDADMRIRTRTYRFQVECFERDLRECQRTVLMAGKFKNCDCL